MAYSPDKREAQGAAAGSVAEAMNRALLTERQVQADIEQCQRDAAARLEEARHKARAILDHAEQTARRIHARTEQLAAARAQRVADAAAADKLENTAGNLARAVRRLAAQMTGGSDA